MYNEGISRTGDIVDLGTQLEIITKRGSFYSYNDIRLGQGRENAKDFLKANPELANEIEEKIRNAALGSDIPILSFSSDSEEDSSEEE
jgi:recombination protein RecA